MEEIQTSKYQKKIITIPNILSFFRLCLIPVIIWLYCYKEEYLGALLVLTLSGITDVADGYIARRWNMISDFGKAFDPVADKLTQMGVLVCFITHFPHMMIALVFLIIKEVFTGISSLITIKKTNSVMGAAWHGKLTIVSLYFMMAVHLVWYDVPFPVSLLLVGICIGIMIMSFILYFIRNIKAVRNHSIEQNSVCDTMRTL